MANSASTATTAAATARRLTEKAAIATARAETLRDKELTRSRAAQAKMSAAEARALAPIMKACLLAEVKAASARGERVAKTSMAVWTKDGKYVLQGHGDMVIDSACHILIPDLRARGLRVMSWDAAALMDGTRCGFVIRW